MDPAEVQRNEVEALRSIFMGDFEEVKTAWQRTGGAVGKFVLHLRPLGEAGAGAGHVSADVEVEFTPRYPHTLPLVRVAKSRGLSTAQARELQTLIDEQMRPLQGREVVFELAGHVQAFLAVHNHARVASFYHEMTERQAREKQVREHEQQQMAQTRAQQDEALGKELNATLKRQEDAWREASRRMQQDAPESAAGASRAGARGGAGEGGIDDDAEAPSEREVTELTLLAFRRTRDRSTALAGVQLTRVGPAVRNDDGSTHVAVEAVTGQLVLVRQLQLAASSEDAAVHQQLTEIKREVGRLIGRKDALVARHFGVRVVEREDGALVEIYTEHFDGGSLRMLLERCGSLTVAAAKRHVAQLLAAVNTLHQDRFVVQTLRTDALFFDGQGALVLGSAGYLGALTQLQRKLRGRPLFAPTTWPPPEGAVEWASSNARKVDVWGLGCVMLEMLVGASVYEQFATPADAIASIHAECKDAALTDVLRRMLAKKPVDRPAPATLLEAPFFTQATPLNQRVAPSGEAVATKALQSLTAAAPAIEPPAARAAPARQQAEPVPAAGGTGPSRFRTDFDEAKLLGKGGFGQVLRARNKLDGRYYAIKRIKLNRRDIENNRRYLREVVALAQLHHDYVVRYYQAWIEGADSEAVSLVNSEAEDDDDDDEDDVDNDDESGDEDDEDVDELSAKLNETSMDWLGNRKWPSKSRSKTASSSGVVFEKEGSDDESDDESDEDDEDVTEDPSKSKPRGAPAGRQHGKHRAPAAKGLAQYLYIQMEYCPNNTLRDVIDAGPIPEDEAWRLLRQIVEGLAYIHAQGLIHRDLKPGNIFLDSKDNVKIGDFGLAVSGMVPVAPVPADGGSIGEGSLTSDIGTALYVSPEIAHSAKYSQKVDIYSLGIVFFEMIYRFSTGMERVSVLSALRQKDVVFPPAFAADRLVNQAELVRWMLNHNQKERPTARQLLQSELIPQKMGEDHFDEAVRAVANPSTPYYSRILSALFAHEGNQLSDYTFDIDPSAASSVGAPSLLSYVHTSRVLDTMVRVLRRHGAVQVDTPLLLPASVISPLPSDAAVVLDPQGELVLLPYDLTLPFARFVARTPNVTDLRRFAVGKVFRRRATGGQPLQPRECDFDIVESMPNNLVADAEVLKVVCEVLEAFPAIAERGFSVRVSHARLAEAILNEGQLKGADRQTVASLLSQLATSQATWSQVRKVLLAQVRLAPALADRLGALVQLNKGGHDSETVLARLRAIFAGNAAAVAGLHDLATLFAHLRAFGVPPARVVLDPALMVVAQQHYYDGAFFQALLLHRNRRRFEIVAAGGRYDRLVARFRHPSARVSTATHAVGVHFAPDKIAATTFPTGPAVTLGKSSDVDVLVCTASATSAAVEAEQFAVASDLWAADVHAVVATGRSADAQQAECRARGISWMVVLTDKYSRKAPMLRVRNVVRRVEVDVTRADLVAHLRAALAGEAHGVAAAATAAAAAAPDDADGADHPHGDALDDLGDPRGVEQQAAHGATSTVAVNIALPDPNNQRLPTKRRNVLTSKAWAKFAAVRKQMFERRAVEVLVVDLNVAVARKLLGIDVLADAAFRPLQDAQPASARPYLGVVREAMVQARRQRGAVYVLLYSAREDWAELYQFFE